MGGRRTRTGGIGTEVSAAKIRRDGDTFAAGGQTSLRQTFAIPGPKPEARKREKKEREAAYDPVKIFSPVIIK